MTERPHIPETPESTNVYSDEVYAAIERGQDQGVWTGVGGLQAHGIVDEAVAYRRKREEAKNLHPSSHRRHQYEARYEPRDPYYDVPAGDLSAEQIALNALRISEIRQSMSPPTNDPRELALKRAKEERKRRP